MAPQSVSSKQNATHHIHDLQQNAHLWYKIRALLYNLRHFKERDDSRGRLELVIDPCYIGAPYFDSSEAQLLKSIKTDDGGKLLKALIQETLDKKLESRKRLESADYRVCAPHDLAPIFEKCFEISPKDLQRDKPFVKALQKHGLAFVEDATGTGQRKTATTGKGKGKKGQG